MSKRWREYSTLDILIQRTPVNAAPFVAHDKTDPPIDSLYFYLYASGAEQLTAQPKQTKTVTDLDRSPYDLAVAPDERFLVTANQISNTLSLIRTSDYHLVDEVPCENQPTDIKFIDNTRILFTTKATGQIHQFEIDEDKLIVRNQVKVGGEPHGLAINRVAGLAYIGLVATGEIAEVDLNRNRLTRKIPVGRWPKYLTLNPKGDRIAVGLGGESKIAIVDVESGETLYTEPLANGTNLGQMQTSWDGQYAYFTWMVYRTNPITIRISAGAGF